MKPETVAKKALAKRAREEAMQAYGAAKTPEEREAALALFNDRRTNG